MRFPSLDGLRAISIVLVLIAHSNGTRGFPVHAWFIGDLGSLGVRVFFVISGFLITSLLLAELRNVGRVDLMRFYARRSVRIFPACYFYILVVWALSLTGVFELQPLDLVFAATYTMNHHSHEAAWHLGHLWSLAVEEQFYLLWPFVLALAGPRRALAVAAATIVLCPAVRLFMIYGLDTYVGVGKIFPTVADSLATGCVLAGVRGVLEANGRYMQLLAGRIFYLAPVLVFVGNALLYGHPTLIAAGGATLLNVAIAICIHRWVLHPGDVVGRWLNMQPVAAVGVLSYSLYLWQQMFLNRASSAWPNHFPLNVILTFAAAWASYALLEKPLMGLRKRLAARRREVVTDPSVLRAEV